MIGRLFSTLRAPSPGGDIPQDAVLAAPPEDAARFAPMVPLTPPPAGNDDPEGALCDAVEAALRDAGYLPEEPPAA